MDKSKKAILALLKTHQPMQALNLVKIVESETGNTDAVVSGYRELIANGTITQHSNGCVTITKK